jgi:hypothetical protein
MLIDADKAPWLHENDEDLLNEERGGFHLVVSRMPHMGNLNGYVGVKMSHPWYGLNYGHKKLEGVDVHGGLTFAGKNPMLKKKYWYFGFDTAHAFDLVPSMLMLHSELRREKGVTAFQFQDNMSVYRDAQYVAEHVEALYESAKSAQKVMGNINHKRLYKQLHKLKVREKNTFGWV